jgi:hypothetical protein
MEMPKGMPNQYDFIDKKLDIVEKLNKNFPFLKGKFEVIPQYALMQTKNGKEMTIAGWDIKIMSEDKKLNIQSVLQEKIEEIWQEKIKPLQDKIKKYESRTK